MPGKSPDNTQCSGISEAAIDSFLESQNVFTVDLDAYLRASKVYKVSKLRDSSQENESIIDEIASVSNLHKLSISNTYYLANSAETKASTQESVDSIKQLVHK